MHPITCIKMIYLNLLVAIAALILCIQNIIALDIQFDRVELANASYVENRYNISVLRISKFNRTAYGLNMEMETFMGFVAGHSAEIRFHYKRLKNNAYTLSPAKITKQPFCDILNKYYQGYWMNQLATVSNFPQLKPDENICPLSKVRITDGNLCFC